MSFGLVLPFVFGITRVAGRHGSLPLHVDRAFIGKKLPEINRNYSQKQDYIILGNDIAEGTESACRASNRTAQGSALGSAAQEENTPCMGKTIMKGAAPAGRIVPSALSLPLFLAIRRWRADTGVCPYTWVLECNCLLYKGGDAKKCAIHLVLRAVFINFAPK